MPRTPKEPAKPKRRSPGAGTVGIRKDGRIYCALPSDLDPKRKPIYRPPHGARFASVEQARAWLDAEVARRRAPPTPAATDAAEPLGAYLARYYRRNAAEWPHRTARTYRARLRMWECIGHVPVGKLNREVVQDGAAILRASTWVRRKKDGTPVGEPRPYGARTITHARATLHQALEELVPEVIPYNPAKLRRRSSKAPLDDAQPVWTAEQSDRVLAVAERSEAELAIGFRLILHRALRIGEVLAVRVSDVDAPHHVLTVDETAGERLDQPGPTKTRRTRDIPLSADLLARIREHRQRYSSTSPFLLTQNGRQVSFDNFRAAWARAIRAAQVPALTPKDGRATCATVLLDRGQPLPVVQQLLGHTSVATTARFYARVLKRRADQTARLGEGLDAALRGDTGTENAADAVNDAVN